MHLCVVPAVKEEWWSTLLTHQVPWTVMLNVQYNQHTLLRRLGTGKTLVLLRKVVFSYRSAVISSIHTIICKYFLLACLIYLQNNRSRKNSFIVFPNGVTKEERVCLWEKMKMIGYYAFWSCIPVNTWDGHMATVFSHDKLQHEPTRK